MPTAGTKITAEEFTAWKDKAESEGMTLGAYIRFVMNSTVNSTVSEVVLTPAMRKVGEQIEAIGKEETAGKVSRKKAFDAQKSLCQRCARIGAPSCPACIAAANKLAPGATETFEHIG